MNGMDAKDMWIRRTAQDGTVTTTHHRVWDGAKFFEAERKRAAGDGVELRQVSRPPFPPKAAAPKRRPTR